MTAHVVHELPVLVDARGRMYTARVLGALAEDGSWDGVIEFHDEAGRRYVTGSETHQQNLTDLIYWSTGLARTYVQGALARAKAAEAQPNAASRAAQTIERGMRVRRPARRAGASKRPAPRTRRASGAPARPR